MSAKDRFWPVTPSGGVCVFLSGYMASQTVEELLQAPSDGHWLMALVLAGVLLSYAGETARHALLTGKYSVGPFGIRTKEVGKLTEVQSPAPHISE